MVSKPPFSLVYTFCRTRSSLHQILITRENAIKPFKILRSASINAW